MPRVLVVDRQLSRTQQVVGADDTWRPLGDGGLLHAEVTSDRLEQFRAGGALGVDVDRTMSTAVVGAPTVEGAPMDMRGEDHPLPSLRELEPRLGGSVDDARDTGEGVLVGVVDTGMRAHPWLDGAYLASPNDFESSGTQARRQVVAASRRGDAGPDEAAAARSRRETGHGTFVTGLVLQQAPAASVWLERALDSGGNGLTSAVVEAATTLARRGVHVLNLSLGCFSDDAASKTVMRRLAEDLYRIRPDMVIVAAAGNIDGNDDPTTPQPFWPAAVEQVLAVGSVDDASSTTWSTWSNRGPWVDLAAPGHRLLSTYVTGPVALEADQPAVDYSGWARWSGTSFSTAVVSGAIARLMSARGITAHEAALALKAGELSTGRTEAEGEVPSVPVVAARSWDEHLIATG
ncbi:subtilase family protein [Motilibacter peucedani]|uniref:Subtilase family protein n=1 Tax=Motilibacter peucedani TaxID=598650 RepID=A0A420XUE2_9ACTN|nr:S8 family serine peptidase [Motilibacter peucedani]RKS80448.1 subtilase family protein [Motilibacter peucedani]